MKLLNRVAGRKVCCMSSLFLQPCHQVSYLLGAVVGLAASVWVYWGDTLQYQWFRHTGIFLAAAL